MSRRATILDHKQFLRECVPGEDFIRATFSGRQGDETVPWIKISLRPVLLRGEKHVQVSYFDARKDVTKNYQGDELAEKLERILELDFRHIHVQTAHDETTITLTRKGKPLIHQSHKAYQLATESLAHDHQKKVLLTASEAAPFLQAVGIMTQEGKIKAEMQSKFKQINEFLKLVEQAGALEHIQSSPLSVVDCGCGNAYLTFAFAYYLNEILHLPTQITGIDTNSELVASITEKSQGLNWSTLSFQATQISAFQPATPPDIVLALHACDTATDDALAQGIKWQSTLIVSVPCCQHHLQAQLDHQPTPPQFRPVERHGILKERLGDILTDAFRALILRIMGYQTDVVQFISSDHTAKNLMIRAVKSLKVGDPQFLQEYRDLKNFWQVTPYLEELLGEDFTRILQESPQPGITTFTQEPF